MSAADKIRAEVADEKDVLDFINSLPDSKSGTPKPQLSTNESNTKSNSKDNNGDGNEEDFLEFLDELAQHEKKSGTGTNLSTGIPSKLEPKKKEVVEVNLDEEYTTTTETEKTTPTTTESSANEEINVPDPISSITNWWSKVEGTTKVNSLWDTIASNAQNIGEQTYQLASTTTNQLNQQRQQNSLKFNDLLENVKHIILDDEDDENYNDDDDDNNDNDDKYDDYLRVIVIYDILNLGYIRQLINQNFKTIMRQVEGDIKIRVIDHNKGRRLSLPSEGGKLNMFYGKIIDGEKLCFANLDSTIKDFKNKLDGKTEEQRARHLKRSNIFISIQPITSKIEGSGDNKQNQDAADDDDDDKAILIESNNADSFSFTIILKDVTNNITIITKTQPFPLKWAKWLDGEDRDVFKNEGEGEGEGEGEQDENNTENLPEDLGIDPSEWVKDWIKQGLNLSFSVLTQEYIIKRMGI
ncbi:maintenance of telomere capping protein 1 [Scheffersomyces amazonensis]|uniref:maintenance of telomere capping protein 1 n=1 Tax=Scheffersomyces amazonensis TaxID=1078765 RepID=UPI00315D6A05